MGRLKIFMSYSHENSEQIEQLSRNLERVGFSIWIDREDLLAGLNWRDQIREALQTCDALIVALSSHSVQSEYVLGEVAIAEELKILIVPILLEDCSIPDNLEKLHYVDFTGEHNGHTSFAKLESALKQVSGLLLDANPNQENGNDESRGIRVGTHRVRQIPPPTLDPAADTGRISLRIDGKIELFVPMELVVTLGKLLIITETVIKIISIISGSIWVELELPKNEARRLYWLIGMGMLHGEKWILHAGVYRPGIFPGRVSRRRKPRKISEEFEVGYADPRSLLQVPLVGKIAASSPVSQLEDFGYYYDNDDLIGIPQNLVGKFAPEELFALKVTGDSMADALIADGDVVVIRRQSSASNGDMVAVWLSDRGETTLKHYFAEGDMVRLQPANPFMDPIYVNKEQVHIQGRVLAVLRTFF